MSVRQVDSFSPRKDQAGALAHTHTCTHAHTHTTWTYIADVCGPVGYADSRVGDALAAGLHCSVSAGLLQEESGSLFQLFLTGQCSLCTNRQSEFEHIQKKPTNDTAVLIRQ